MRQTLVRFELDTKQFSCDSYERKYKGKNKKNMRCFPTCCEAGHQENGFCGRAVIAKMIHRLTNRPSSDLLSFAMFREVAEDNVIEVSTKCGAQHKPVVVISVLLPVLAWCPLHNGTDPKFYSNTRRYVDSRVSRTSHPEAIQ